MTKQTIEIDVPEGYRPVCKAQPCHSSSGFWPVLITFEPIPKTKRRPPTKHDLLGVDSLPCWVRDHESHNWVQVELFAIRSLGRLRFYADSGWWRYCEIEVPDDEQPLLECWVDYFPKRNDPWGASWPDPLKASAVAKHMIEVREPKP